ncbi:hypothetical protein GmHk_18G052602 [Glycine max]|nr:hypothetical protein GmHk_18G052602 [Glycine max]
MTAHDTYHQFPLSPLSEKSALSPSSHSLRTFYNQCTIEEYAVTILIKRHLKSFHLRSTAQLDSTNNYHTSNE